MSIYIMSRKFKKLTLQYAFLKLEKEEVKEICENQEKELHKYMKENHPEYYKQKNIEPKPEVHAAEEDTPKDIPTSEVIKNKDLKKLYRRIASKTHPDKISDEQYDGIFSAAARAYEDDNLAQLLEIAGGLNIEVSELSAESVALLENNISSLNKDIINMKSSTGWAWHKAKNPKERKAIIDFLLKHKGAIQ
jgi:hypothetical protein